MFLFNFVCANVSWGMLLVNTTFMCDSIHLCNTLNKIMHNVSLQGMYFVSSVLLMRMNVPKEYR